MRASMTLGVPITLLGLATGLSAQSRAICGPTTAGCAIEMELATTLVPAPDGGVFTTFWEVLRLRDGRYPVANEAQAGEIEVYSADGRYLRTVGRRGEGPGEYMHIREMLIGDADSIIITDVNVGRLTVLGPDLTVDRTTRLPYRHREMRRVEGGYVLNGQIPTPESAGLPIHYVDDDGRLRLSFGADTAIYRPDLAGLHSRPLTTDGRRRVWAGYTGQYVIDRFDLSGTRQQRFVREADWFPAWSVHPPLSPEDPPLPQLVCLQLGQDSTLWTLVLVPAPDFAKAFGPVTDGSKARYRLNDYYDLFHAVLEVFDAGSGELLASKRVPGFLFGFADEHHVVGYRERPDLLPRLDVWRISLQPGR